MGLERIVDLSSLQAHAAREYLHDAMLRPQGIAPMPRVCAQLADLTAQEAMDSAALARLIESDPSLAGELMRIANSPVMRPRVAVMSLRQAVSWLGLAEVRNIAMAVMLRGEVFVAPGHEPESEELWRQAWLAGLWAREVARGLGTQVETAFLAALMHRTGAALALKILARYELEQRTVLDARSFADLVAEFEPRFGPLLMNSWRLPAEVQAGAGEWRDYGRPSRGGLAGTVHAAQLLATHTLYPQLLTEDMIFDSPVFEHLGLRSEERRDIIAKMDEVRALSGSGSQVAYQ